MKKKKVQMIKLSKTILFSIITSFILSFLISFILQNKNFYIIKKISTCKIDSNLNIINRGEYSFFSEQYFERKVKEKYFNVEFRQNRILIKNITDLNYCKKIMEDIKTIFFNELEITADKLLSTYRETEVVISDKVNYLLLHNQIIGLTYLQKRPELFFFNEPEITIKTIFNKSLIIIFIFSSLVTIAFFSFKMKD